MVRWGAAHHAETCGRVRVWESEDEETIPIEEEQ